MVWRLSCLKMGISVGLSVVLLCFLVMTEVGGRVPDGRNKDESTASTTSRPQYTVPIPVWSWIAGNQRRNHDSVLQGITRDEPQTTPSDARGGHHDEESEYMHNIQQVFKQYPGSRAGSVWWRDADDNVWMFGGRGYHRTIFPEEEEESEDHRSSHLNDLWIWLAGYSDWKLADDDRINDDWRRSSAAAAAPRSGDHSAVHPPPREHASMCGITGKRIVMFGGKGAAGSQLDHNTWIFDLSNGKWSTLGSAAEQGESEEKYRVDVGSAVALELSEQEAGDNVTNVTWANVTDLTTEPMTATLSAMEVTSTRDVSVLENVTVTTESPAAPATPSSEAENLTAYNNTTGARGQTNTSVETDADGGGGVRKREAVLGPTPDVSRLPTTATTVNTPTGSTPDTATATEPIDVIRKMSESLARVLEPVNNGSSYAFDGASSSSPYPEPRYGAASWCIERGNESVMLIFGGRSVTGDILEDMWMFNIGEMRWTQILGPPAALESDSVYVWPDGRVGASTWVTPLTPVTPLTRVTPVTPVTRSAMSLYMFGGESPYGISSSMWRLSVPEFSWEQIEQRFESLPRYHFHYSAFKLPPYDSILGRQYAASWTDKRGILWLFGGERPLYPYTEEGYQGDDVERELLPDLWQFSPGLGTWSRIEGLQYVERRTRYGKRGASSVYVHPGPTSRAVTWTVNDDTYFYGGLGLDGSNVRGYLNALWRLNVHVASYPYSHLTPGAGGDEASDTVVRQRYVVFLSALAAMLAVFVVLVLARKCSSWCCCCSTCCETGKLPQAAARLNVGLLAHARSAHVRYTAVDDNNLDI